MSINDLIENFKYFDNWEDKYRYIIELGESLATFPEKYKTDDWKINGCASQVWLVPEVKDGKLSFIGDSDALIVKGLIAIVLTIFSDKSAKEILETDVADIFKKLGLDEHLTPSRRNGLFAMTEKIKFYAEHLAK